VASAKGGRPRARLEQRAGETGRALEQGGPQQRGLADAGRTADHDQCAGAADGATDRLAQAAQLGLTLEEHLAN
jgi:hypothetical protein